MPYPENKEFSRLLDQVQSCFTNELPFVMYRKPGEKRVTAVFQKDAQLNHTQSYSERGFVFAPFDLHADAVLIRADATVSVVIEIVKKSISKSALLSDKGKEAHIALISKAISEIQAGKLKKVVLSRKLEIDIKQDSEAIFLQLLACYPNAFCYLWFHPKVGTWCGATPETLLKINGQELSTMSLAATMPYIDHREPSWGDKEIEEQQMVSEYICEHLSEITNELRLSRVESIRAGNLWHLKSEIQGTLRNNSITDVVDALHPTPAVCGIPTRAAQNFIKQNESYQRTYYTGFLGELNLQEQNNISLFVNLRCMEIHKGTASIFVGGGITAASDPEKEWAEIQNKSRTLLNVLEFVDH